VALRHGLCWNCLEVDRQRVDGRSATTQQTLQDPAFVQRAIQSVAGGQAPLINGGSSMSNNAKKSQASVMLVFPGPDGRRYRIVSFVGGDPSRVEKYVLDEEREDTVGDKFWQPTTTWVLSSDLKLQDILMSAILYLMNPNALIANDAELEGRKADAATITAQPADKRKKGL
jgi:hypothetical protein